MARKKIDPVEKLKQKIVRARRRLRAYEHDISVVTSPELKKQIEVYIRFTKGSIEYWQKRLQEVEGEKK